MSNPWLHIPPSDYEDHMTEVGQAQVLNKLTKQFLRKYKPVNFALLGCSTGNGLEHIQAETKKVYAIDINREYLSITEEKFKSSIDCLEVLNIDIQEDELAIKGIDLLFAGLVLEYVDPEKALKNMAGSLGKNGVLVLVLQKSGNTSFVSRTKHKRLEKLSQISREVDEKEVDKLLRSENLELTDRSEIELPRGKSFIVLEYKKKYPHQSESEQTT